MKDKEKETLATLTPPWYTLRNEIAALFTSIHVKVGPLQITATPYIVPIDVDDNNVAIAIASILPDKYPIGNITVVPKVTFNGQPVKPITPPSPSQLDTLVRTAFRDNVLLENVIVSDAVYPIFAAQIVQFYNDDISEAFRNFNAVLATCARNVLAPTPGGFRLLPSTAKITVSLPQEKFEMAATRV